MPLDKYVSVGLKATVRLQKENAAGSIEKIDKLQATMYFFIHPSESKDLLEIMTHAPLLTPKS